MITESTVLIISFFIVFAVIGRRIFNVIKGLLCKYHDTIDQEISKSYKDLEVSREELSLLSKKNVNIEHEVAQILNSVRLETTLIANKEEKILTDLVEQKLQQKKSRILHQKSIAIQELKEQMIKVSTDCTYKLTTMKLNNEETQSSIINFAIEQIPDKVH